MRVAIWGDMEGISCITKWDQVNAGVAQYAEGRALYTGDVNACVRGAKRAGATSIVVVDGHGAGGDHSFNSLLKEQLEPGAEYVFGHRWGCCVEPFEQGCDALMLVGAHAMAGTTDAVLSHTMSSSSWHNAFINGRRVGESALAAGVAGAFGVPLVFVSGDEATVREARSLVECAGPDVQSPRAPRLCGVAVKRSYGRYSACCLPPADSWAAIELGAFEALKGRDHWPSPWRPEAPVEIRVEMLSTDRVDEFRGRTGCRIIDDRTVAASAADFYQAWDAFWHH